MSASDGSLQISGSGSYAVAVDAKAGAGAQIQAAVTDANAINNSGKYRQIGGTVAAADTAQTRRSRLLLQAARRLSRHPGLAHGNLRWTLYSIKLRTGLSGTGNRCDPHRQRSEVRELEPTSRSTRGADAGAGGLGGVAASANLNATDESNTSDPTSDAISALSAISSAVIEARLGAGQDRYRPEPVAVCHSARAVADHQLLGC